MHVNQVTQVGLVLLLIRQDGQDLLCLMYSTNDGSNSCNGILWAFALPTSSLSVFLLTSFSVALSFMAKVQVTLNPLKVILLISSITSWTNKNKEKIQRLQGCPSLSIILVGHCLYSVRSCKQTPMGIGKVFIRRALFLCEFFSHKRMAAKKKKTGWMSSI